MMHVTEGLGIDSIQVSGAAGEAEGPVEVGDVLIYKLRQENGTDRGRFNEVLVM